jgi:hypothetical protein
MIKKTGKPQKENLLTGFCNLDTGEEVETSTCTYYPSMKAAAYSLKIDISILRDARSKDCPAFRTGGLVHREQLMVWLKKQKALQATQPPPTEESQAQEDQEEAEDYSTPDEEGGVGRTLKSLQQYERRAKQALDKAERMPLGPIKTEEVKRAQDAWIKVVNALLKYDLSVSLAKRESGELIPLADAAAGVQALLAWHTVATSDALRNVIPDCEGKTKYEIAGLLDKALRSSIYRNFKLGVSLHKIPDWMGKTASEFVYNEKPLVEVVLSKEES